MRDLEEPTEEVQRTILFQNESFEIISILWSEKTTSTLHNHGWSQCHVLIEEGLFENTLYAGAKTEIRRIEVGQVLSTPVGSFHEMRCLSKLGKTLHVYTPKISAHSDDSRKFCSSIQSNLLTAIPLGKSVRLEQLNQILQSIQENSISTNSPFFMNQLFSGIHPQALIADQVIAQTKTTMATQEASPVFSKIEKEVISQLCALIGWKAEEHDGVSAPGGSAANFMALQLAKHKKYPETKIKGLSGHSFKIFVSSDAHYSFQKAAISMGFGTDAVVNVGVDRNGKMDTQLLHEAILYATKEGHQPLMVCATAGTTVYGAFDSIKEIHQICKKQGIWLHVDAAWGGPALFSEQAKHLVEHIELSDSVTFDAHKLFGASLTCSFLLTQHKGLLLEANDVSGADYLFHNNSDEIDRGKMSWQCGRRADALSFWSIWKNLGTDGLGSFVDQLFTIRDQSLDWIRKQPRLEIIKEPSFLNMCIRIRPPTQAFDVNWSQNVREKLKEKNLAMVNYSSNEDGTFLRLILAHPQITAEHIRQILSFALDVT